MAQYLLKVNGLGTSHGGSPSFWHELFEGPTTVNWDDVIEECIPFAKIRHEEDYGIQKIYGYSLFLALVEELKRRGYTPVDVDTFSLVGDTEY